MDSELETLWVRFKGDTQHYTNSLNSVISMTQNAAAMMARSLNPANWIPTNAKSMWEILFGRSKQAIWREMGDDGFGGIFSPMINSLPLVGGAAAAFFAAFTIGSQTLINADNQARRLGMSVTELRTAMAWGDNSQAMPAILQNVNKKLQDFHYGNTIARQDLESLSKASGVGMLAKDFAGIVDQLSKIQDPTTRASMAFRLLGDQAGEVLRSLGKGNTDRASGLVKSLGLSASPEDIEQMRKVSDTMRELGMIAQGVWNQILLGLAPVAAELSKMFNAANLDLTWIRGKVMEIAKGAAMVGAFMYEAFTGNTKVIAAFFELLKAGIDELANYTAKRFQDAMKGVGQAIAGQLDPSKAFKILPNSPLDNAFGPKSIGKWEEKSKDDLSKSGRSYTEMLKKPESSGQWKLQPDGSYRFRPKLDIEDDLGVGSKTDQVKKDQSKLEKALETLRESAAGKGVEDMWKRMEASINNVGGAAKDSTVALQDMNHRFLAVRMAARSSADAFHESIDSLRTLRNEYAKMKEAMPAGNALEINAYQAAQRLIQGVGIAPVIGLANAAEYNTREAASAVVQYRMLGERGTIEERIQEALDIANQQRMQQINMGERVLRYLDQMSAVLGTKVRP